MRVGPFGRQPPSCTLAPSTCRAPLATNSSMASEASAYKEPFGSSAVAKQLANKNGSFED